MPTKQDLGHAYAGRSNSDKEARRALVLLNEKARSVAPNVQRTLEALQSRGFHIVRSKIPKRAEIAQLIKRHLDSVDLVIVGGGDGTLNCVLQGIIGSGLPLGLLPLGTANDLAKTLGIPHDLQEACDVIAQGHSRLIDVGRVNDAYFFNEASIGLSVALCRALTGDAKARFGVLALLYNAIVLLVKMRRFRARVRADGDKEFDVRTVQLTLGNSRNFGGFIATDDAEIDDRLLDFYSVGFEHGWSYFDAFRTLLQRRYDEARSVHTMHGKRFEVWTHRHKHIEADGEIVSKTPAVFEVVPRAVSVFVPAPPVKDMAE
ncbi:MAG TPA: lipid kinase [Candidatus Eremiobacteraceae bacterium]|nr:lipid kinase [Candidatus Eremiobacteraceae bacterium]